jgi:hypothetical protein
MGVIVLIFKQEKIFCLYFFAYLTNLSAARVIRVSVELRGYQTIDLIATHTVQAYMGSTCIASLTVKSVSGELQPPAILPVQESRYPLNRRLDGP